MKCGRIILPLPAQRCESLSSRLDSSTTPSDSTCKAFQETISGPYKFDLVMTANYAEPVKEIVQFPENLTPMLFLTSGALIKGTTSPCRLLPTCREWSATQVQFNSCLHQLDFECLPFLRLAHRLQESRRNQTRWLYIRVCDFAHEKVYMTSQIARSALVAPDAIGICGDPIAGSEV